VSACSFIVCSVTLCNQKDVMPSPEIMSLTASGLAFDNVDNDFHSLHGSLLYLMSGVNSNANQIL